MTGYSQPSVNWERNKIAYYMRSRMGSRNGPGALNKNFLIMPGIESHLLGRTSRSPVIYTNYVVSAFTDTQNGEVMLIFTVSPCILIHQVLFIPTHGLFHTIMYQSFKLY